MGKLRSRKLRELPKKLQADLVSALTSASQGYLLASLGLSTQYDGPRSLEGRGVRGRLGTT